MCKYFSSMILYKIISWNLMRNVAAKVRCSTIINLFEICNTFQSRNLSLFTKACLFSYQVEKSPRISGLFEEAQQQGIFLHGIRKSDLHSYQLLADHIVGPQKFGGRVLMTHNDTSSVVWTDVHPTIEPELTRRPSSSNFADKLCPLSPSLSDAFLAICFGKFAPLLMCSSK